jgi:GTP:adenosylcobinamide-phosphate guanylyltransferase
MDAIITAGGIPKEEDLLYEYTQGGNKALLDLGGKPLIQWVLDAVSDSKTVNRAVIVGLDEDSGLNCSKEVAYLPNHGTMLDNIFAGGNKLLSMNPDADIIFVISSDIPGITAEMLDWMTEQTSDEDEQDVYYNYITQEDMENRFPGSKRTFTKFKDFGVCGGDLTAFRAQIMTRDGGVWKDLVAARKNILKQASIIGFGTLFLLATRQLTIADAAKRVGNRLELNARAIRCPYPELGMDVDKPYQLDLLRADLEKRNA